MVKEFSAFSGSWAQFSTLGHPVLFGRTVGAGYSVLVPVLHGSDV